MSAAEAAVLAAYRAGSAVARALPGAVALPAAGGAARLIGRGARSRRAMVRRHLRRVHGPALAEAELDREVGRAFASYGRYWVEAFRLPATPPEAIEGGLVAEGVEHLDAALADGCGAIMALPHLGNWDFGGAWLALRGYRVTVVVEPLRPPALFEWFTEFRRGIGMTVVPLGPDVGGVLLRALRRNELVGLLCDRDIGGGGVDVEFFGERSTLPAGPATLALRTGAHLLPTAVYLDDEVGHRGVIRPRVPLARAGRLRDDIAVGTQAVARELEALIRPAPSQWHLFQPNWPSDREPGR